jgi:hypothetical protein
MVNSLNYEEFVEFVKNIDLSHRGVLYTAKEDI